MARRRCDKPAIQDNGGSARLRRELVATKEYLQSIVEDNATTLEELRAANEEAQAGNEELETAQEELESANEELNTLNEELKISNLEFSKVNRDLTNLLESISIPLVMVGRDLRIRRFTRAMEPMLNLIASDVGRSITDLQPQIELPDLRRLLLDAMEGGNRQPRDIRDSHGRWYSLRILPSVGPDGKTDGAVLMLIDIDAAKRGLDFAEAIVETVREPSSDPEPEPRSHESQQDVLRNVPGHAGGDRGTSDLRPRERTMEYPETARVAGEHSPRALDVPGL